ncbi:hypothetical protein Ferp_0923 [Ferroglobus placidus DSM 10642]|uniref:Class III signal peptide-containing protein n=1 Tax=Ferroglobus placidus (strain DSM 10642 / AEDII12DO) TaxID=589924 RepID=D3RX76_FERPA|nr:hypothetical protein [Ferroglobus placidus]ADC65089.1 hypothetical protein Ferp_0923 [Ferroglobus placidus DSM 10642]
MSETLEALFLLSILSLLVMMVLLNYNSVFKSVEETAVKATMQNVAAKIVNDLHAMYYLTIYPGNLTMVKKLEVPEKIGGETYIIRIKPGSVELEGKYSVFVPISSKIPVEESEALSVNAYLVYHPERGKIEVTNLEER